MNGLIWQHSSHKCSGKWTRALDITTHSFPVVTLLEAKLHLNLVIIVAINSSAINTSYHISLVNSLEVLKGIICQGRPSEINLDITSPHHRSSATISQSTFRESWRWYRSLQINRERAQASVFLQPGVAAVSIVKPFRTLRQGPITTEINKQIQISTKISSTKASIITWLWATKMKILTARHSMDAELRMAISISLALISKHSHLLITRNASVR